jgi:Mg2+/Co2+ transporter CorB
MDHIFDEYNCGCDDEEIRLKGIKDLESIQMKQLMILKKKIQTMNIRKQSYYQKNKMNFH